MSALPHCAPIARTTTRSRLARSENTGSDVERRIEDWIVSYLDDQEPRSSILSFDSWLQEGGPRKSAGAVRGRVSDTSGDRRRPRTRCWARIEVRRIDTAILVRLLDPHLIKPEVLDELDTEFNDLIQAGYRRILIDFSHVEKISAHLVSTVARLRDTCKTGEGGALRLFGVHDENREILLMLNPAEPFEIHNGQVTALTAPWPERGHRPLPLTLFNAIKQTSRIQANQSDSSYAVVESTETCPGPLEEVVDNSDGDDFDDLLRAPFFWLIVELTISGGPTRGSVIPVRGDLFVIGRGASSDLRLSSPQVSRLHARIERRGEQFRIVDQGSGLGTIVNGRNLSDASAPLRDGDIVRIGPLVASVLTGQGGRSLEILEDMIAGWLQQSEGSPGVEHELETIEVDATEYENGVYESDASLCSDPRVQAAWIQGVLVITPRIDRLDQEEGINIFRAALDELWNDPSANRVVLNLSHVSHVSSRWLGIVFAYFLRLERSGGSLRLCELHARVFSVLEQVRLPVLMTMCSTVDEAVIQAWD